MYKKWNKFVPLLFFREDDVNGAPALPNVCRNMVVRQAFSAFNA